MSDFRIVEAEAADAALVPPLIRRLYGDSFSDRMLYDAAAIAAAAASGRQFFFIALNAHGEACGLIALSFSLPSPALAEVGMAIVDPELSADSGGRVLRRLMEALVDRARRMVREQGLRCLVSSEVTSHRLTQRLAQLSGFVTTGIHLGVTLPEADRLRNRPADRSAVAGAVAPGSETVSVKAFPSRIAPYSVALPVRFEPLLRELYASLRLPVSFVPGTRPEGTSVALDPTVRSRGGTRLEIVRMGADIVAVLEEGVAALAGLGAGPHHVILPLGGDSPDDAVDALIATGFRYGSFIPLFRGHDVLVLQNVGRRPVRLTERDLHAPAARRVFRAVIAAAPDAAAAP